MTPLPGMSEKAFQDQVVQLARLNGFLVYHTFDSRRSVAGYPDLVLLHDGEQIVVELKTEHGRVRPEQDAWLVAYERAGVEVHVWRPSDFDEIEARLARRPNRREAA